MMMIPEPWENHESMDEKKRAFYEYHGSLMEPWDGPASIAFTDGTVVGAVLDRNGLRPSRYYVTKDDLVIMASEVGVLDVPPERVLEKRRLQPGRMFLVDTSEGRIISDEEIKQQMAAAKPYGKWLKENLVHFDALRAFRKSSRHQIIKRCCSACRLLVTISKIFASISDRWRKMVYNPLARWARTHRLRSYPTSRSSYTIILNSSLRR